MANEVSLFGGGAVPAFVKNNKEVSALTKALAGGGGGGKRLSIKGGVFRLIVDGKEISAIDERYLDVVIVNAAPKIGRTWYAKAFDPNSESAAAPDCWSADGNTPDATAANKQHSSCEGCPKNIKGSGSGDSRACRFSQRVAVVLANDIEGNVMQLSLPAQSIFGDEEGDNRPLQAYARFLAAQRVEVNMVITRLKFDTKAENPKLFFKPMRYLVEEEYEAVLAQGKTPDAIKAITMTVAAVDGAHAAAPAVAKGDDDEPPAPAPAKKAVDEEPPAPAPAAKKGRKAKESPPADDEAGAPEPTVRKDTAAAAAPRAGLASVLSNWGDD